MKGFLESRLYAAAKAGAADNYEGLRAWMAKDLIDAQVMSPEDANAAVDAYLMGIIRAAAAAVYTRQIRDRTINTIEVVRWPSDTRR